MIHSPRTWIFGCCMLLFCLTAFPQRGDFRIVFYNVENLFNTRNDPDTEDEEFLPGKGRNWNDFRFSVKLNRIAKVLIAAGGWEPPEIIGLCEIETRSVVEQLTSHSLLKKAGYKIVHKESPDDRGIDVSMIYRSEKFTPLQYRYFPVRDADGRILNTREILYVQGIAGERDTLHLFFNHWPSRYSGYLETAELRKQAAEALRRVVDRLFQQFRDPGIIIAGDFNDQPSDDSILKILHAGAPDILKEKNQLINLSYPWVGREIGTYKYQSQWQVYDQVIVSANLLSGEGLLYVTPECAGIFISPFLLTEDLLYGGNKPLRTYYGYRYEGGFSDHLPVYLDLFFR
jgi:predicted extracellular nuclease